MNTNIPRYSPHGTDYGMRPEHDGGYVLHSDHVDALSVLEKENTFLRVKAQAVGCPYGNTHENGACKSGYPGCACADDLMALQVLSEEDEQKVAVRLRRRLEAAEDLLSMAMAWAVHYAQSGAYGDYSKMPDQMHPAHKEIIDRGRAALGFPKGAKK